MIQPTPSSDPSPATVVTTTTVVLYEIVASGDLPSFNPLVTVKQRLLTPKQIQLFNRVIFATRNTMFPMYMLGFLLRFVVVFAPVEIGRILGPVAFILQFPIAFQVVFALRLEYAKVLIGTFEFWFLVLNATIWAACFAIYLQDTRALLIPMCWLDFVNLLLIETYFQNTQNVTIAATSSACFLLALSIGVSLNAVEDGQQFPIAQVSSHILTTKDILVNTMATMITLLMRLSYRKYAVLRDQRRSSHSTTGFWTQSIGYRCRIELRPQQFSTSVQVQPVAVTQSNSNLIAPNDIKLLHMQFVRNRIRFDAELTVYPGISRFTVRIRKWQLAPMYCAGLIGFVLTPIALPLSTHTAYPEAAPVIAITGLCATVLFWLPFLCCAQRQLVLKLWTSFDFLFVFAQLMTAHVALCDMLSWEWVNCCGVLSSFLWMLGVLTIDTITPVMRSHLGWRSWLVVPMVASFMTMQALLLQALFQWNHQAFRNRLLFDGTVSSYQVEFYVVPFFLSRQFTLFVWCVRILNRFWSRKNESELLLLLGNVEFNYAHWKQRHRQQQEGESRLLQPFSSRMRSFGNKLVSNFTRGRRGSSQISIMSTGNERDRSK